MNYRPNEQTAIKNLQIYLRRIFYTSPEIPTVPIDGIYGSSTRDAVIAFQKDNGLNVTGVCDRTTWNAIYAAYMNAVDASEHPLPLYCFPGKPANFSLCPGSEDLCLIYTIQFLMFELSLVDDDFEDVKLTGKYDAATEAAVRKLQRSCGLCETGTVNIATWNALARIYDSIAENHSI